MRITARSTTFITSLFLLAAGCDSSTSRCSPEGTSSCQHGGPVLPGAGDLPPTPTADAGASDPVAAEAVFGTWNRMGGESGSTSDLQIGGISGEPASRVYLCQSGGTRAGLYKGTLQTDQRTVRWDTVHELPEYAIAMLGADDLRLSVPSASNVGAYYRRGQWSAGACGRNAPPVPPPPSSAFSLTLTPGSATVVGGSSTSVLVTASRSGGFTGEIKIAATGLPAGVSAAPTIIPTGATTATLVLMASATAPVAIAQTFVQGTADGAPIHKVLFTLTVARAPGSFSVATNPTTVTVQTGQSTTATVTVSRVGSFTGAVMLEVEGLPQGVTATFGPPSIAATSTTATLNLTASGYAPGSTSTLTIRGVAFGANSATAPLTLVVKPAGPTRYRAGFSSAAFLTWAISPRGDRCEWTTKWTNGVIDVTLADTAPGRVSGTVRIEGTVSTTAVRAQVGTTNCLTSEYLASGSANFETVLPNFDWTFRFGNWTARLDGSQFSLALLKGDFTLLYTHSSAQSGGTSNTWPLDFARQ